MAGRSPPSHAQGDGGLPPSRSSPPPSDPPPDASLPVLPGGRELEDVDGEAWKQRLPYGDDQTRAEVDDALRVEQIVAIKMEKEQRVEQLGGSSTSKKRHRKVKFFLARRIVSCP